MVNLSVLAGLRGLGAPLGAAYALAIWAAATWNFGSNRWLTFDPTAQHPVLPQYGRFLLAAAVGAGVSWLVAMGLVNRVAAFAGHEFLAALAGIAAGALVNFLFSALVMFCAGAVREN